MLPAAYFVSAPAGPIMTSCRLVSPGGEIAGYPTWSSFLAHRMAPAMHTCATMEDRQANLSIKLPPAADLLRTRVDVELEEQNRDLLRSMNDRTRLQLHLQSTVEGLSVAAIGYCVVSLFGYLAKGAHDGSLHVEPSLATAFFVPVAVAVIWIVTRNIHRRHLNYDELIPMSTTVAPRFTQSAFTISGRPTAATRISARRHTSGRSLMRECATVTFAYSSSWRHRLTEEV